MLKNLRTGDKFLIAAVIAAVIAAAAVNVRSFGSPSAAGAGQVVIFLKGTQWGLFNLRENRIINVNGILISVAGGKVRITKNDCPRQVCMRSEISKPGEAIICVPKRLIVEITGEGVKPDSVAY